MAAGVPRWRLRASHTSAMPPSPSGLSKKYCPTTVFACPVPEPIGSIVCEFIGPSLSLLEAELGEGSEQRRSREFKKPRIQEAEKPGPPFEHRNLELRTSNYNGMRFQMVFRVVATCAVLTMLSAAQPVQPPVQPPPDHKPIPKSDIKVSVNEVIVPITVTDDKGRFVSDLDQKDFRIL